MRLLLSRLSALGDVVCSLPVAVALQEAFPAAEIWWAADRRFADLPRSCSAVSQVMEVKPGFRPSSWPVFPESFDAALDLQGLFKSAIVVARAKSPVKLGYHWQREGSWLFSQRVLPDPSSHHVVDQYLDVARAAIVALGGELRDGPAQFGLQPSVACGDRVDGLLTSAGVKGKFVILNAGAGWESKRWPVVSFARIAEQLVSAGLTPVFIGGKAQADVAAFDQVQASTRTPLVSLLGQTSVGDLVALVARAAAHVGGDTGSSHLAAALGVPAIGLYSITRPQRSCPYGQVERCHDDPTSLAAIQPDPVWRTLEEALRS